MAEAMDFKEFNDLAETFRMVSKHIADGDEMVHQACNHLVEVFKASMLCDDPLLAFAQQLERDASYTSWKATGIDTNDA